MDAKEILNETMINNIKINNQIDDNQCKENNENSPKKPCNYVCYLLKSETSNRTYIGVTTNLKKRLRQHNGEICGGAKYTRSHRPWKPVLCVSGFYTKNQALSFEYRVKKKKNSKNKLVTVFLLNNRIKNFIDVLTLDKFTSKCINPKDAIYKISIFEEKKCRNLINNNCNNILVNYNEFAN
jgi:putative endonuclease